ncbi:hypothetical protein PsYK624_007130 [Phanerochaete sordida]|uniref:Uncharacterized protein n=1 Tax=Phanerochaete sordida TaxID=48140 RepID=A0A9P3FWZ9_9APHY|nr:hypothetical protein PsYK624_007130 [Phanerochaete sordida]
MINCPCHILQIHAGGNHVGHRAQYPLSDAVGIGAPLTLHGSRRRAHDYGGLGQSMSDSEPRHASAKSSKT